MQNPERIRSTGRIVGMLVGLGAALVVILILVVFMALTQVGAGGTIAQRSQTFDTFTTIGAGIAFVVGAFVYYRVRRRYEARAEATERGTVEDG